MDIFNGSTKITNGSDKLTNGDVTKGDPGLFGKVLKDNPKLWG